MSNKNIIKYGIPSHKRAKQCKTYDLLKSLGVSDSDIVISLNKKEDLQPYKSEYPNANIIYKEGKNVAINRNNILNHFSDYENIVLLDDDINKFVKLTDYKNAKKGKLIEIMTAEELNTVWLNAFEAAKKIDAWYIGVYPASDPLFMTNMTKRNGVYGVNYLFCGSAVGIINNKVKFNEEFDLLEDYELVLRLLNDDKNILRINILGANRSLTGKTVGGNEKYYSDKKDYEAMDRLKEDYIHLFKPHIKKNGVLGLRIKPFLHKSYNDLIKEE